MPILHFRDVDVDLQRKAIRQFHLVVYPPDGRVRLSVPWHTPQARVETFLADRYEWLVAARRRMMSVPPPPTIAEGERRAAWLRLRATLDTLLPRWEATMQTQSSGYTVRLMKSRWGSCNVRTRRLTFNLLLALEPLDCVEYVVVHELCHTFERLHNARFYALMDRFLPDWRERRQRLNQPRKT